MERTHDILTRDNFGTMFASTLASNQLNNITMRTKMTFIMTALQAASLALILANAGNMAVLCFVLSTAGAWAALALDNK